ncbi:hypothetical protein ABTN00_20980, partial [Acinetobacter baumannii]
HWLHHRSFYDFWLLLHQRSPLQKTSEEEDNHLLREVFALLLAGQSIHVIELPIRLRVTKRYEIQDMMLIKEDRYDV